MLEARRQAALREAALRLIGRSCREQNISFHVEDPLVLGEIAALLHAQREQDEAGQGRAGRYRRRDGTRAPKAS
jgi:hypothetical protein